jgi:hypothetical protein
MPAVSTGLLTTAEPIDSAKFPSFVLRMLMLTKKIKTEHSFIYYEDFDEPLEIGEMF